MLHGKIKTKLFIFEEEFDGQQNHPTLKNNTLIDSLDVEGSEVVRVGEEEFELSKENSVYLSKFFDENVKLL